MKFNYAGKRTAHGISKRLAMTILALALVLGAAVGGTLAWLNDQTEPLTNTFVMGTIVPGVDEEFNKKIKTDVKITNTSESNIPVFVRVALIPTWEDNGSPVGEEASLSDLEITWGATTGEAENGKWVTDGKYYYYTVPVPAGESTANLINRAVVETSNGYQMNLQIIVDAIQPTKAAVEGAWNGVSVSTDSNGSLYISTPDGVVS